MAGIEMLPILKKHFPFWEQLSENEKKLLLRHTSPVTYRKGENIHRGDTDCIGVLLLERGSMRVYMLSEEGREITLYRHCAGETCILSATCVLKFITFEVHIDAETDCELALVSADAFAAVSEKNPVVENFSYRLTAERFSDVMWAMQQILFMSFDRRLAIFLLEESAKSKDGAVRLTHEQVARYIGSAREVVTRMLNYFADEGVVALSRGDIRILDEKKLRRLAGNP